MLNIEDKNAIKELQEILKNTPLNEEEQLEIAFFICASSRLKFQKHCREMVSFLEDNPNASYDEIQDQADLILGIDMSEE